MQLVEFDPRKDDENVRKHGISLKFGEELEWDFSLVWPDNRHAEPRLCALVPHGATVYFVAFQDRGTVLRMISIRRSDKQEYDTYVRHAQANF